MWKYFGVMVNAVAVIIGALIGGVIINGLSSKKKASAGGALEGSTEENKMERLSESITLSLALCVFFSSVSGLLDVSSSVEALFCVVSIVVGYVIGFLLHIDDNINRFCDFAVSRIKKGADSKSIGEGIVTASMIFCIGSMTILGSIESAENVGATLDISSHSILILKSILDFVMSISLSTVYGFSVAASALFVFIFQGALVFLAAFVYPFLLNISAMGVINATGSIILVALSVNISGIKRVKVGDYIPSIPVAILLCYLYSLIV